jgi:catechol 2,3-dioxygenase-like lactoylglutathione lyase family enzyme
MKLNHINLAVVDLVATRDFFVKYFGFQCVEEKGRDTLTVLRGDGGLFLTLSHFRNATEVSYPQDFHVGFILDTRSEVDEVYHALIAGGVTVDPPRSQHGGWSFYVRTPGTFLVEVVSYEGGA